MANFFYGFAIPMLAAMLVVLFRINAEMFNTVTLLKEIRTLLKKDKPQD